MSRRRRGLRYKGAEQPAWLSDALGVLFVLMLLGALLTWLLDELRRMLP